MIIGTFLVYFALFIVVFSIPGLRNKEKTNTLFKFLAIPALFGVGMVFLSVIKVYFVYKLFALVLVLVTGLLSYWQWGQQIRRWWK
jgi:protein-S-isoprenylcysteine O-methyltransferase Ste14